MVPTRFPFDQIAVPFRMQPGLRRLDAAATHLTPLAEGGALWREKKALLDAGGVRLAVPGLDEAPILAAAKHASTPAWPAPQTITSNGLSL